MAWFLSELDDVATQSIDLHCLGGFVVTQIYGLDRTTSDVDVLLFVPNGEANILIDLGQNGSELHNRYKIYLDPVTIVSPPDDYDQRLIEMFPGTFRHIRLFALDPYDLALTKMERNSPKDRADVKYLAKTIPFDTSVLSDRYYNELRNYLSPPEREDLTLRLWIEMIEEELNILNEINR